MSDFTNTTTNLRGRSDEAERQEDRNSCRCEHDQRKRYVVETQQTVCPPVWAYYRQLSGKEYYAANAENVQEEIMFQINYRNDLTTRHVIRYRGELWDITRIDDYEGRKEDLKVYCKRKM